MNKSPRQMTFFSPKSEWVAPTEFPDLSAYETVAIDLETCDPNLRDLGSGWPRADGYIIGVAVAVADNQWYFPIRHEIGPNLDARRTLRWLASVTDDPDKELVFHNAQYDVGWLLAAGVKVSGHIRDTMVIAPLLDENRFSYSLNNLSRDYLADIKSEKDLREAAAEFGVDPKSEMYKLPASFVGAYAEQDAALTLRLWNYFQSLVIQQDISDIVALEHDVLATVIPMRRNGVRIDTDRAEQLKTYFAKEEQQLLTQLHRETGKHVEIWAAASIAEAFDAIDLPYPRTEKTEAPSFTKFWLKNHTHTVPKLIVQARELNKARTTFVDTILKHSHNGRIHAELHQLRNDGAGTITGRFSYSSPNLQQMPARNAQIGPMIRSLFLPEQDTLWGAFDYSSQEPRLVVHYASLLEFNGAQAFADEYHRDVATDFHQMAADIVGLPRKQAKDINLGLFYGMGTNKLATSLGLEIDEGKKLFEQYHAKVPFVNQLSEYASKRAATKGVIRTLLGRRCRFDKWEPSKYGTYKPMDYEAAFSEHGPSIRRAFTYKALNKLIQGSAADQTKAAMVALYKNGYLPMIQVHDELDVAVSSEKDARHIKEIMETCVSLQVPSLVDAEFGTNWGEAKQSFSDKPWTRGLQEKHSVMIA